MSYLHGNYKKDNLNLDPASDWPVWIKQLPQLNGGVGSYLASGKQGKLKKQRQWKDGIVIFRNLWEKDRGGTMQAFSFACPSWMAWGSACQFALKQIRMRKWKTRT